MQEQECSDLIGLGCPQSHDILIMTSCLCDGFHLLKRKASLMRVVAVLTCGYKDTINNVLRNAGLAKQW